MNLFSFYIKIIKMVDVKTTFPSLKDLIDRIKPVENSRLKSINENALWLEIYNDSNSTEKTCLFKEHLGIRTGKALCLHRWKVWWMIPKLIPDQGMNPLPFSSSGYRY